jgi:Mg-chelatase subunit ChlD
MVLVIDSSSSMEGRTRPYGPSKLGAAVAAASLIVDYLEYPKDRVSVVQFNDQATVLTAMTDDWATARMALQRVTMQPGTRIDAGVAAAQQVLTAAPRREGSRPIVVLLTDGRPTRSRATQVITAAERLKATGATLYTVGLGPDADPDLLLLMASSVGTYYHAPGTEELARIYRDIAQQLICK